MATSGKTIKSENGFVLVTAVLMLVVVAVIGLAANRTSETEVLIAGNEKQIADEFYDAEGTLINTLENPTTWMPQILTGTPYTGATSDANIEIRWVDDTGTPVAGLSSAANDLPSLAHIGPPPPGCGYSLKYFEVRRYAVTTTSSTGNTQIQAGIFKVFNKN